MDIEETASIIEIQAGPIIEISAPGPSGDSAMDIEEIANIIEIQSGPTIEISAPGPQGPPGPSGGDSAIKWLYSTATSDYYVDFNTDTYIAVDSSTDPVVVYLPVASNSNKGWGVYIAKIDNSAFAVNVSTQSGQTIDDLGTSFPMEDYQVQLFISTGTGYKLS